MHRWLPGIGEWYALELSPALVLLAHMGEEYAYSGLRKRPPPSFRRRPESS